MQTAGHDTNWGKFSQLVPVLTARNTFPCCDGIRKGVESSYVLVGSKTRQMKNEKNVNDITLHCVVRMMRLIYGVKLLVLWLNVAVLSDSLEHFQC